MLLNKPTHISWDYQRGEKAAEKTFQEIMAENIPNLLENNNLLIQKPQQTLSRINAEIQRDTIVKMLKVKDTQQEKND